MAGAGGLVDANAQTRLVRDQEAAVLQLELFVADLAAPNDIADHDFQKRKLRHTGRQLQCRGVCDRSAGVMRGKGQASGVRHGRDFLELGQAARVADIRLQVVCGFELDQAPEILAGVEPLAGGDGDR